MGNLHPKVKQRHGLEDTPPQYVLLAPPRWQGKEKWHAMHALDLKASSWKWYTSYLFLLYGFNSEGVRMCIHTMCHERRGTGINVSYLNDLIPLHKNCLSHILYYYPHPKYKYWLCMEAILERTDRKEDAGKYSILRKYLLNLKKGRKWKHGWYPILFY